jgi:hypothetical protein
VQDENKKVKEKCFQLEYAINKMKEDNKKLAKLHRQEIRWREKKELGLVIAIGVCAMLYVLVALAT